MQSLPMEHDRLSKRACRQQTMALDRRNERRCFKYCFGRNTMRLMARTICIVRKQLRNATWGIAVSVMASAVHASNYTGTVLRVAAQPSTIAPATQTRFSILTTATITTACASASVYSFDLSNTGLAAAYESILITAIVSNTQVTINGSGVCDAFGIEEVQDIWLL